MAMNTQRMLRRAAFVVAALAVAFAGMRVGAMLRARNQPVLEAPAFPFEPGQALPDVQLADSTGATIGSVALVAERHGAVMLFLDPNCHSCEAMATRWQRAVEQGAIEPERVIAVTRSPADVNAQYRATHALAYPLYQDVESAFLEKHGVVTYPMEMEVGASGNIRALSTDSVNDVDGDKIRALIEN